MKRPFLSAACPAALVLAAVAGAAAGSAPWVFTLPVAASVIGAAGTGLFGLAWAAHRAGHATPRAGAAGDDRLALTEAKYRAIVDTALDAIATIDERGTIQSFNRAAERIFGYDAEEVVGRNIRILMPERTGREHDSYMARYLRAGERRIIGVGREVIARRKDGSEFPIELSVTEWFASGQRFFTGLMRDITAQKQVEAALRENEQRFRSLFEESPLGKAVVDAEGRVLAANPALCRMFGRTAEALAHARLADLSHPDDHGIGSDAALAVHAGKLPRARYEKRYVVASGETIWASVNLGAVPGPDGVPAHIFAVIEDITERKRAEEALRASGEQIRELQAEFLHLSRLSEIGQMAATLAHELNQPLAANANYLNACRRLLDAGNGAPNLPRAREALGLAAKEAMRAGQIIRRMRSFVARGEADKRIEDLARMIEEASELVLIPARQHRVAVRLHLAPDMPRVLADRVQIQQVLFNLMRNAVEAMEESERRVLTVTAAGAEDGAVAVSIADTGPGISPEIAGELFQPFVSTKQNGTGIGLSVSRTIVEAHGGRIQAEPNPGGGTIFRFTLPAVPETEGVEAD